MDADLTDRTLLFTVRTTAVGSRQLFKALTDWIGYESVNYRRIDQFTQHVDGVPMEIDNYDNTKELSKASGDSYGGSA